jgi:hypothetical protein
MEVNNQGGIIMNKQRYFKSILIAVIFIFVVVAGLFFFNFDHFTAGKLEKVEVILADPVTGGENIQKTFTDKEELDKLTSVFFGKFNESIFLDTAEDSKLSVVFTFENKVITFKLFGGSIDGKFEYTYVKYPQRKMRFSIPSDQRKLLLELMP